MVCGILVSLCLLVNETTTYGFSQSYKFGVDFAAVTLVTMGAYSWFTIKTTSWR